MKISPRQVWLWSAIVAGLAIAGGVAWYWVMDRAVEEENVAHVDWLPVAARNICYYRSRKFTAAEFLISEEEFVKWCHAKGFALSPIGDEPIRILRYSLPGIQAQWQASSQGLSEDQRIGSSQVYGDAGTWRIKRGLYCRQQVGQEIVLVGYDRDVGAAFYESHRL